MYAHEDFKPGQMLGCYELLVPIAQGGAGSVWAARQQGQHGFEKIVAVKLMLAELCDDVEAENMFLDEARLMSLIRHVNVVKVIDFGEDEAAGALYIVMEWIDGEPLTTVAREARRHGGMPLSVATQIIKQACSGLHAAHQLCGEDGHPLNLVHRDVSPHNLIVGFDGRVKVIDFGVAKASSNQQRTAVGQLKGKAAYMAPEQTRGEPLDRRTDVFALGIVLYQLVTGKHPFRGDNEFATMKLIRDVTPVTPPSVHVPSLPPALDQAIVKALAKDRNERFATMSEFNKALERAIPAGLSGVDELAAYMQTTLGPRAERKREALREALQHGSGRLGSLPSLIPIADPLSTSGNWQVLDEETASQLSSLKTPMPGSVRGSVPSQTPAPQAVMAPLPAPGGTAAANEGLRPYAPEGRYPAPGGTAAAGGLSPVTMIAGIVTIVVLLLAAAFIAFGGSNSAPSPAPAQSAG